jgi:predicted TIM-barrel fold metal-dependent hydrolase
MSGIPASRAAGRIGDQTAMIDTHVHLWDLARFRYPWMDDPAFDDLRKDYLPADYRAEAAETAVDGWIHMQAEIDHQLDPVAETEWVGALAEEGSASGVPGPLGCIVYADLRAADVHDVLSRHCRYPLTRGVRQEAWFDPASTRADIPREDILSDPAWQEGDRALAEFGLSFDLLVWPAQLQGAPAPLAVLGVVSELLELFGPQRCMVGSNFPVERLAGDFRSLYKLVLACLRDLSAEQRADVLAGTARRFYRIRPSKGDSGE